MGYAILGCRCLLALVFAVAAFTKLRGRSAFGAFVAWFGALSTFSALPATVRHLLAAATVAAEALLVVVVLLPWTSLVALWLATAMLAGYMAGAVVIAHRQPGMPCQCFGASAAPLGTRAIVRNAVLLVIATVGAVAATHSGVGLGSAQAAATVLSLVAAATAAMTVIFLDDLVAFLADRPPTGSDIAS